jgi:hypothetical protein
MLRLISGRYPAGEAIEFFRSLDKTCALRWLTYFYPTVDISEVDVANIPAIKRAIDEKRREIFGDKPKGYAVVCGSESSKQYFDFWSRYWCPDGAVFGSLDEAYDWLGLSETDRAAASRMLERWIAAVEAGEPSAGRPQGGRPASGARASPGSPAR